jgi:hypothetical protein
LSLVEARASGLLYCGRWGPGLGLTDMRLVGESWLGRGELAPTHVKYRRQVGRLDLAEGRPRVSTFRRLSRAYRYSRATGAAYPDPLSGADALGTGGREE